MEALQAATRNPAAISARSPRSARSRKARPRIW
jgi:hypothetical protein